MKKEAIKAGHKLLRELEEAENILEKFNEGREGITNIAFLGFQEAAKNYTGNDPDAVQCVCDAYVQFLWDIITKINNQIEAL